MVALAGENGPGMLESLGSKIGREIIQDDPASLIPGLHSHALVVLVDPVADVRRRLALSEVVLNGSVLGVPSRTPAGLHACFCADGYSVVPEVNHDAPKYPVM
ncbi:uncharacterized protein N7511_003218 [Penicillium nucicola]|uniref:uncharacterized protein n=1 Tax=Penicillium nucicola TaxID=1850975 RepID=UPI00254501C5|nr:uncharacterized protein N7511_003218 [Penicillium nucicola]KAJ5771167.1 hypothetical protein N7511_003218 [Penicillium nucicola]